MELAFGTKTIRKLCEAEAAADRYLGLRLSRKLRRHLADILAAFSISDLPSIHVSASSGAESGQLEISLGSGFHILLCANHVKNPALEDGTVDWLQVSRLKILHIGPKS